MRKASTREETLLVCGQITVKLKLQNPYTMLHKLAKTIWGPQPKTLTNEKVHYMFNIRFLLVYWEYKK